MSEPANITSLGKGTVVFIDAWVQTPHSITLSKPYQMEITKPKDGDVMPILYSGSIVKEGEKTMVHHSITLSKPYQMEITKPEDGDVMSALYSGFIVKEGEEIMGESITNLCSF